MEDIVFEFIDDEIYLSPSEIDSHVQAFVNYLPIIRPLPDGLNELEPYTRLFLCKCTNINRT